MSLLKRKRDPLCNVISFRVSDQELQSLKKIAGSSIKISNLMRHIITQLAISDITITKETIRKALKQSNSIKFKKIPTSCK